MLARLVHHGASAYDLAQQLDNGIYDATHVVD
jgi:hypothetical protein